MASPNTASTGVPLMQPATASTTATSVLPQKSRDIFDTLPLSRPHAPHTSTSSSPPLYTGPFNEKGTYADLGPPTPGQMTLLVFLCLLLIACFATLGIGYRWLHKEEADDPRSNPAHPQWAGGGDNNESTPSQRRRRRVSWYGDGDDDVMQGQRAEAPLKRYSWRGRGGEPNGMVEMFGIKGRWRSMGTLSPMDGEGEEREDDGSKNTGEAGGLRASSKMRRNSEDSKRSKSKSKSDTSGENRRISAPTLDSWQTTWAM